MGNNFLLGTNNYSQLLLFYNMKKGLFYMKLLFLINFNKLIGTYFMINLIGLLVSLFFNEFNSFFMKFLTENNFNFF